MVFDGYLAIGDPVRGQLDPDQYMPLIDNTRTAQLARQNGIGISCVCAPLTDKYYDPTTLPWYDPAVPESVDFLGVLGIRISGVSNQVGKRSPIRVNSGGAVMGRLLLPHREIGVHGYMVALTQCALSYGMSFLSRALQGTCMASWDACTQGMPMTLFTCCSTDTQYRRQLFDVALLDGPEQTSLKRPGVGGNCNGKGFWGGDVSFTLAAGKPWLYRDIVILGSNVPFVEPVYWPCVNWIPDPGNTSTPAPDCSASPSDACVQWVPYTPAACHPQCAGDVSGTCMVDPQCPEGTEPPLPPDAGDPCACLVTLNPVVVMARSANNSIPKWSEAVPWIQVQADANADMRRILIRFYRSQVGATCNYNNLNDCDLLGEIGLPFLPKGASLTLDGRAQTATVVCPDGGVANPQLYSTAGPAAVWPVLECSDTYCVAVTVDPGSLPDTGPVSANITIGLVAREAAA